MKDTLIILTPGFPLNEEDSTCLPPQQVFVKALKETYPQLVIRVISLEYPLYHKKYSWHGIPVRSYGRKRNHLFSQLWDQWQVRRELKRIHAGNHIIGILNFWCGKAALAGTLFARKYGIPVYTWILGQDARKINTYVRYIRPGSEELVALSEFIAAEFEKNHRIRPAHIIPPGIDPGMFAGQEGEKDIDIMGAGSLIPLKQFDLFLQVVAAAKKEFPHIKALLAGNGTERESLEQQIKEMKLTDTVHLIGSVPHPEVLQLMKRTKIFVHPSAYEGFGVVCIEALYAGARVVSFVRPMNAEIDGWHFVSDLPEMTNTVISLLKEDNHSSPQATSFPISNSVSAMMQLFNYRETTT